MWRDVALPDITVMSNLYLCDNHVHKTSYAATKVVLYSIHMHYHYLMELSINVEIQHIMLLTTLLVTFGVLYSYYEDHFIQYL